MLTDIEKKVCLEIQGSIPLSRRPFREIADAAGVSEDELLARLKKYYTNGQMRKMGAVLKHRQVGYAANALCAWIVPYERHEEVGGIMMAHPAVTHCYGRITAPDWPYNFYTMIHSQTRAGCSDIAAQLSKQAAVQEYVMLFSTKEWKKTSMHYFRD